MRFALFTIVIVWAVFARAHGQCNYEIVATIASEPCPNFGQLSTYGTAMNSQGDVAGFYLNCGLGYDAFFWSEDTGFITLPLPAGVFNALAYGLNDNRIVCGEHQISGVGARGFVYDINNPGAGFTYLEPLHGAGNSYANAINNNNAVAGSRAIGKPGQSPNPLNAVIWRPFEPGSPVEDLGVMNGPNSWARGINDADNAVGLTGQLGTPNLEAWIKFDDQPQLLGPIPGGISSGAGAISDNDIVAGAGDLKPAPDSPSHQGVLWSKGSWTVLPLLAGATGGQPFDVNVFSQATGRVVLPGLVQRAVLWQHEELYELIDLIVSPPGTVTLQRGVAINNDGLILSRGTLNGKVVAFVLEPVDRPLTDLNADCVTNVHDLLMLLDAWGPCMGGPCPADFNGDGVVDVLDLLILLDHWDAQPRSRERQSPP